MGPCPPKFLKHLVVLWFEGRFSKENSVIRQKSNILASPKIFASPNIFASPPNSWPGYATDIKAVPVMLYQDKSCYLKWRSKLNVSGKPRFISHNFRVQILWHLVRCISTVFTLSKNLTKMVSRNAWRIRSSPRIFLASRSFDFHL